MIASPILETPSLLFMFCLSIVYVYKECFNFVYASNSAKRKYEKKAKDLIRVIQSPKFTIQFAKLGFSANENFTVLQGNKH